VKEIERERSREIEREDRSTNRRVPWLRPVDETVVAQRNLSRLRGNMLVGRRE